MGAKYNALNHAFSTLFGESLQFLERLSHLFDDVLATSIDNILWCIVECHIFIDQSCLLLLHVDEVTDFIVEEHI